MGHTWDTPGGASSLRWTPRYKPSLRAAEKTPYNLCIARLTVGPFSACMVTIMARRIPIQHPGVVCQVIARGSHGQAVLGDSADRHQLFGHLR